MSYVCYFLSGLRRILIESMMRSAKPARIIPRLSPLRNSLKERGWLASYGRFIRLVAFSIVAGATLASYFFSPVWINTNPFPFILCSVFLLGSDGAWEEDLGGNGPRIACYARVSTSKQAKEGYSIEAQLDKLKTMVDRLKPSYVYWFVDPGKSGTDFDKRKIGEIMRLKEKKKIMELWVTDVDRIGRDCRKLLTYFLQFCDEDGKIRTPERIYGSEELEDILIFAIRANAAQEANNSRTKAAMAGKARSFQNKNWNKPVPLGYLKDGKWLAKDERWQEVIKSIFEKYISLRSVAAVRKNVNTKHNGTLIRPLTRDQIYRMLSNPVYIGEPTFLGTVVKDDRLAFVDRTTFDKVQNIIRAAARQRTPKEGPLEVALRNDPETVLEFLDLNEIELVHRRCGGCIVKNGIRWNGSVKQQALICSNYKKGCQFEVRFPTRRLSAREQEEEQRDEAKKDPEINDVSSVGQQFKLDHYIWSG